MLALLAFQRTMHFAAFRKPIALSLHRGGSPAQDQHIKRYLCLNCESAATHLRSIPGSLLQRPRPRTDWVPSKPCGDGWWSDGGIKARRVWRLHLRTDWVPFKPCDDGWRNVGVYIFARIGDRPTPADAALGFCALGFVHVQTKQKKKKLGWQLQKSPGGQNKKKTKKKKNACAGKENKRNS